MLDGLLHFGSKPFNCLDRPALLVLLPLSLRVHWVLGREEGVALVVVVVCGG